MQVRSLLSHGLVCLVAFGSLMPSFAAAEPVWARLNVFKRIEADPDKEYRLTEANGPWLIMAATFLGDEAEEQAHDLVLELRRDFKLEAYIHDRVFDYSGEIESEKVNKFGEPAKMRYRRDQVYKEFAVLVGNFPSVDDRDAQKVLDRIKHISPEMLDPEKADRPLSGLRELQRQAWQAINSDKRDRGPMARAFIVTNPLLPPEFFNPPGLDPLLVEMNKGVEYSLLKCPGEYSVQVASFSGDVVLDQTKIAKLQKASFSSAESRLAEAALKAHEMTMALREKGFEAYEFHDRYISFVTVGSFNSVGTPRVDGQTEINPEIHRIMETFGSQNLSADGDAGSVKARSIKTKSFKQLPYDIQPLPVRVPRQTTSAVYTTR